MPLSLLMWNGRGLETTAPTDKKRLVDRDKLAELTRQLCPARQKAVLLVVEMIEAAYPSSDLPD
jgi:hypothetical protein